MNNSTKFVIQFVNHETGARSESFVSSAKNLEEVLRKNKEENDGFREEDHILVIGHLDSDTEEEQPELRFGRIPIMTIKTFLESFNALAPVVDEATAIFHPSIQGK